MCIFHIKCQKTCRTSKSHFRHWEHIRKYVQKRDSTFISYWTYNRLSKSAKNDLIQNNNKKKIGSSKINHSNYEKYLIKNMVSKLIYDIIKNI